MHTKAGQAQGFALFENGAAAQHAMRSLSSLTCAPCSMRPSRFWSANLFSNILLVAARNLCCGVVCLWLDGLMLRLTPWRFMSGGVVGNYPFPHKVACGLPNRRHNGQPEMWLWLHCYIAETSETRSERVFTIGEEPALSGLDWSAPMQSDMPRLNPQLTPSTMQV